MPGTKQALCRSELAIIFSLLIYMYFTIHSRLDLRLSSPSSLLPLSIIMLGVGGDGGRLAVVGLVVKTGKSSYRSQQIK